MTSRSSTELLNGSQPGGIFRKRCACGRLPNRPNQRTCRLCHAEDMKKRRAEAVARGSYTLRKQPW